MPEILKLKQCPVCQEYLEMNQEFKFIQNYKSKEGNFDLFQCPNCQVQFWMPFKNPGPSWYENCQIYDDWALVKPRIKSDYHKKTLQILKKDLKGYNFLDMGCGIGVFLFTLEKRGAKVFGVDFTPIFTEFAKKYFNLKNIFVLAFSEFFEKKDLPKFDYITFFEVIEHIDNPQNFIQGVKKLLKPKGTIILSVPCRERAFVNWEKGDFPRHHLSRWNEESLKYFLEKNNFIVKKIIYVNPLNFIYQILMSKTSLGFFKKAKKQSIDPLQKKEKKNKIMIGIFYFLIIFKKIVCYNLAVILFLFSKLLRKKNGGLLCWATLDNK